MKKILVVEDDADSSLGYHVMLAAHGYATVRASDGVSAIRAALEQRPDLIILDLGLPGGDGFDVLAWLRGNKQLAAIPVIVVSGLPIHVSMDRALKAGASAYLQKPPGHDELLALIETQLKKSKGTKVKG